MLLTFMIATMFEAVPSINLDTVNIERARALHGRPVVASFIPQRPPYRLLGRTMVGAAECDDGTERGAVLWGNRLGVEMGKRLAVAGVLRVIEHPPGFVGGVLVPGWCEVRIEEVRP